MVIKLSFYVLLLVHIFQINLILGDTVSKSYSSKQDPYKNIPDFLTVFNNNLADVLAQSNSFSEVSDYPENCSKDLENFSNAAMNSINCFVTNARPIRLCCNCFDEFAALNNSFNDLKLLPDECQISYFRSDRLGIINTIFIHADTLWRSSKCENCNSNSNETTDFINICEELDVCIKSSNKSFPNDANNTCELCNELYVNVTERYNKLLDKTAYSDLCMDIVDKMNITRQLWGKYKCINFDIYVGYPNVLTAVLVGTMPLFFYLLAKNVSIIEDVKIVRPKRKSFVSMQPYE